MNENTGPAFSHSATFTNTYRRTVIGYYHQTDNSKIMKKPILIILISFSLIVTFHLSCKRSVIKPLNMDFEQVDNTGKNPVGWIINRYSLDKIELDKNVKYKGKYSFRIENSGKNEFKTSSNQAYRIIKNIHPKNNISISGFIKTEDNSSDSTGLSFWYSAFSIDTLVTLKDKRLLGTNDWQEFSITVPVKEDPDYCFVGISQIGKGKIWIDNIEIKIDGKKFLNTPLDFKVTNKELKWLKNHYTKLETYKAGESFEDLQPLKAMIGGARVVGLGENTHGSREVFMMKHRLVEFLATEMGFNIFAIEANMPEAYKLNDYILTNYYVPNDSIPKALLRGMYFWTWNTQEVLDMIKWMRQFNTTRTSKLQFTGFDMQYYMGALQNIANYSKADLDLKLKIDTISFLFEQLKQKGGEAIESKNEISVIKNRCYQIQAYLIKNKCKITQSSDSTNYKWLIQNASLLIQCLELAEKGNSGSMFRDECMAKNVKWILENNPNSKIILWAHNGHITKHRPQMGYCLDQEFGVEYYNIGFASNTGKYTAVNSGKLNSNNILEPGKPGSFEYQFHNTGTPLFYFDFSKVNDGEPEGLWLKSKLDYRSIGAVAFEDQFYPTDLNKHFNAIIYIDSTSATKCFDLE
jgi:erythromycin esterase